MNDVAPTVPGGTLDYVKDKNQKVIVTSKTTGNNGRLTFDGLTYGVYEIREVSTPPGYVKKEDITFYLRVDGGNITYVQKGSGKPSEWEAATSDESATVYYIAATSAEGEGASATNATFRVSNEPGASLPSTGGIGTAMIYLAGGLLVMISGTLLVRRRRAER
ncbi:MAG: LPXTG cell wall anchor domain-containing protein [Mogibacterium sp.]|nr:LPXTG cell wall anchor domain-containing protein [Mogibacterium sp.]